MAGNLTDIAEAIVLDAITGRVNALFTPPLRVGLVTAIGDDATGGTDVTGGTYAPQTVTFDAAAQSGSGPAKAANSSKLSYTGMPACSVVGYKLLDSAATPRRICWIPATQAKSVNAGDTYEIAAGDLVLTID